MPSIKKYLIRFGFLAVAILLSLLTSNQKDFTIFLYKISLVLVGTALAELIWITFFKTIFGAVENLPYDEFKIVFMGRAILYSSVIISLGMGL